MSLASQLGVGKILGDTIMAWWILAVAGVSMAGQLLTRNVFAISVYDVALGVCCVPLADVKNMSYKTVETRHYYFLCNHYGICISIGSSFCPFLST
jgi:hypothetical protein